MIGPLFPGTGSIVLVTQAVLVRVPVELATVPVMLMVVSPSTARAGSVQVTTPLSEAQRPARARGVAKVKVGGRQVVGDRDDREYCWGRRS